MLFSGNCSNKGRVMTERERYLFAKIFKLSDEAKNFVNYAVGKLMEGKSPGTAAVSSGTPRGKGKQAGKTSKGEK
jgi:hypothetical protein